MFSFPWFSHRRAGGATGEALPGAGPVRAHGGRSGAGPVPDRTGDDPLTAPWAAGHPAGRGSAGRPVTGYWGPASSSTVRIRPSSGDDTLPGGNRSGRSGTWTRNDVNDVAEHMDPASDDVSLHADMARVDADMASLDRAVDTVLVYLDSRLVSRHVLINPLLSVWEAARAIDASVTRPVERLLTRMISREMVASDEVRATVDDTRARAIATSVVSNCVSTSGR